MLPPIFAWLKASPDVLAILGATPRIYRHGAATQGAAPPYIVWSVISGVPENNLSDLPPVDRVTVQVDCYCAATATGDQQIVDLATAVRNALEPHGHMTGMPVNQRETETNLYRIALQFDIFLAR